MHEHRQGRQPQSGPVAMTNPNDVPSELAPAAMTRQIQQRAIATRAAILAEAAKSFDASGYSSASINSLIANSDLTKGAIFHHFPSKGAIAQQLVQGWTSAAEEAFSAAATTGEPSSARLRAVFLDLANQIENDVQLRAGIKLTLEPAVEGAHQAYRRWVDATSDVVEDGIAEAMIDDSALGHRLAWNLCAGFAGAVNAIPALREDLDLPTRIDDLLTVHLAAVVAR